MRLTHIFIGIMVFVLFGVVIMGTAIDLNDKYERDNTDDFMQVYYNLTGNRNNMVNLSTQISNKAPGGVGSGFLADSDDFEGGVIRSSWKALSFIPRIYGVFKGMLILLVTKLMLPPYLINFVYAIFIIVITFILISSVLRHRL